MLFAPNDVFRAALRQHALENGGDYYYLHNDKSKVTVYCMNKCGCPLKHGRKVCTSNTSTCGFKAYGKRLYEDDTFQLKTFKSMHSCGWRQKNTKLTSTWLADKYLENYRDDPSWKIYAFLSDVRRKYNVELSYNQAWKEMYSAMLKIQGNARDQYAKIWDYAATIRKQDSGSTTFVKVDNFNPQKPLFQRLYISFATCIKVSKKDADPLLVDGCHLRGAYTGHILVAVGTDGNNNIFPNSYAVVEVERRETWD